MSQKGMKLTKILQSSNQFAQTNSKYQPLRNNIQQTNTKINDIVQRDISQVSYVAKRLKSLSPEQNQFIRETTFIPLNCRLTATQNQQKRQRALSQKYRAINLQEKQNLKPISPNTFQKVAKNRKVQVVYEYNCSSSNQNTNQVSNNKVLTNIGQVSQGNRQNVQIIQTNSRVRDSKSPASQANISQVNSNQVKSQLKTNESKVNNLPHTAHQIPQNIYTQHQAGGNNYYGYVNDDNQPLDGPAFYENQGRSKYGQIGRYSKQQFEQKQKSRVSYHPGNIQIGGRSKSSSRHNFDDFQSNIGINSKHNKNLNSTKEYSYPPTKQDILQGQQTSVKGHYSYGEVQEGQQSKMREYVQNVQSRIVIGSDGKNSQQIKQKNRIKIDSQKNPELKQNQNMMQSTPQIDARNKKLKEYQQSGNKGYDFKKNQQNQAKRKKEQYKYNLYSILDEQLNLKCATGFCKPNQICASQPKRQGWN